MDTEKIVEQARRILKEMNENNTRGGLVEAQEFVRKYAGENSSFYGILSEISAKLVNEKEILRIAHPIFEGFIDYVENGLLEGMSIERKAQIDVVSDFLSQAQTMLETKKFHPAASAMIIGASLEEFLRNWAEEKNLPIEGRTIDSYAKALKKGNLITRQDKKDIDSWAQTRNDAAHGNWDDVSDRKRILLMLEGVNLFMRKYGENRVF